ncbi:hypothetical protein LzC2_07130 [Planctomycetes bacterium LzC2]|uniref:Bacterial sugar transferase domain-containing protein n=2 Tax=Alienimonas chondri TaxID=2681879 RepID=A0ABX1V969_9PLAN|nr:hypothetical protein [Alienimonas chondri]
MRADRGDRPVSVVALPVVDGDEAAAWAARGRVTDRIGWLPDGRLALLLWDTDEAGARRFLRSAAQSSHAASSPAASSHVTSSPGGPSTAGGDEATVYVYPSPDSSDGMPDGSPDGSVGSPRILPLETLLVRPIPAWKRATDLVGSSFGLLALSPLLLAIALAVKLTSPGPVLFSQWRTGLGGRPFRLYKFRSMAVDAEDRLTELRERNEQDGPAFKMTRDPRTTRPGRLMRRTGLDELPQLWNVLRGEMSLVGPRPLPVDESDACQPWQRRRLTVTPGLTCGWQIQMKRTTIPFAEWVRMDLRYADCRNPRRDLALIARTVAVVLGRSKE